jgi:hypothetical protein
MKSFILNSLVITATILGIANTAAAKNYTAVNADDGTVYLIDLDDRSEYVSKTGWRHVKFWLTTRGDSKTHRSTAACEPYQVESPFYNLRWRPNGGGYPEGTLAGEIARAACNN